MINIFVIDDHPVFIDGLRSIFSDGKDKIKITGSAGSAKEAIPKLKRSHAKVVLLDLVMPEVSGVELCLIIKNKFPEKKVIALTGELNPEVLFNTWMNKADAILIKYCGKSELVDAINAVLAGRRVLGINVPEFYDFLKRDGEKQYKLTPSEQQVLNLLAEGHSRDEVGQIIGRSINSVNFHCKNIFKKFNKKNLVSVIEEARHKKLIL